MKIYVTKRQFEILSILEREKDWINSDKLGIMLHVSNKTIQKEIRALQQLMPNGWSIKMTSGLGYHLEQPFSDSVKIRFVDKEALLTYDILNSILKKEVTNLTELSEKLFLSLSTVHTSIKELNEGIKSFYNLEIIDRPLRVHGRENDIRRLIFDMDYFVNSIFNDLELFIIEKKELDVFFTTDLRVNISLYNKNIFYVFLNITIQRIKEGYEADGYSEELMEQTMSTDLYRRVEPLFSYIEKTCGLKLSANERFILYYSFIRLDFHLVESYDPDFFKTKNELNTSFLTFIDYLSDLFNLKFKDSCTFMINAFNLYYLNNYDIDLLKYKTYHEKGDFKEVIKEHNLPLDSFSEICNEWGKLNHVTFTQHLITSLLILIQEYNVTHTRINVLVVKSHSFILNNLLMAELKGELNYKVNFLEYEPSYIRNFQRFKPYIDFILSDIPLINDFFTIPHIYLSNHVTEKKLAIIRKLIHKAIKEKERLTLNIAVEK